MDKAQVPAARRLWMERDGVTGRQEVALQIGMPQWIKGGGEAVCAIAIKGLYDVLPPARGRDFIEALANAMRTLRQHCKKPPEGTRFFYFDEPSCDQQPYDGELLDEDWIAAERRRTEAPYHKDWSVLVERKILMQRDGSEDRSEVVLRIGHPYWMIEGEAAACPIAMKGEDVDWVEHREGRDLFEALSDAVRNISERFEGPQRGRSYFWADGKPYRGDFGYFSPRHYEQDPRGISGNWKILAERTLMMERAKDPNRRTLVVRIGHPYWVEKGVEASCPIEIDGFVDDVAPVRGENFYHALFLALEFFDRLHKGDPDIRIFWPDGTPYQGEPLNVEPTA